MASPASDRAAEGHPTGSGQSGQYDASNNIEDANDYAEDNSPAEDGADDAPKPQPMQKRRRVTRACDECRRKKIKCDGKQPCTHCTVYSYECTYDQPSNRRRNAAPQYIEALESQLKRAKALLHVVFPTLDLNDPNLDAHLQNGMLPQLPMGGPHPQIQPPTTMPHRREGPLGDEAADSHLESMVKATGQLDLDDEGNWDYHGHSSGLSFMRRLEQQYGDIIIAPSEPSTYAKYRSVSQALESPLSTQQSPAESSSVLPAGSDLPIKQEARVLCENALIDAGTLLRVVHLPTFYKQLDRIYDVSPENYSNAENNFLPLLYSVLALGTLFPKNDHELDQASYESTIEKGYKYFRASRQLLDIADCRDLTSLQAIVFMIQFLQSSAKLSTCYAYIGVALRSALRMGLHRSLNIDFTPIEAETRKRIFWVIRRMDTYVGAMLGLPRFLNDEDIDQDWPAEVDDEYITETEIRPMPEGRISVMAAFNAHTRIVQVLSKICKYVYPIKGTQSGGKNSVTYSVGYSKIREIEQDLAQWLDELPMALRPGGDAPQIIIKVQQLLRMAFGHAQLLLYRPFLHYVSQSYKSKPVDQRAFACASACVSVSRNIVHITSEMKKAGLLTGAYWFSMYTTFFAVVSILYFVLENPNSSTSHELFRDALEGKEVLAHFAKNSMAADRCSGTLNTIFDRLPESVKRGVDATDTKKRRQGSSPQSLQSRPNLLKQDEFIATAPRRASTFPESIPGSKRTTLGPALPISQNHFANFALDAGYNSPSQSSDFLDTVPSLTPTSSTTSHVGGFGVPSTHGPFQRPSFPATPLSNSFTDPSGMNVPLSDIAMMMFPNKDPMAYPNQPMTTFENNNPHAFERNDSPSMAPLPHQMSGVDMKPSPHAFIQPGLAGGMHPGARRPENEVQLFGPMPMYLMQGARAQRGFPHHAGSPSIPLPSSDGGNMQFDDILAGEEWAQTFMDPGLGLSSAGPGFGGGHSYGSVPPGMGSWR